VNLIGKGITNIISREELAAIATAIIHGHSLIATDSLTSMHQINKQLSHPNFHRHNIQGDVAQSTAKAIRQSPSPIFTKLSVMPALLAIYMFKLLLESHSQLTLTLPVPPSRQQVLSKGNPFCNINIHWRAKEAEDHQIIQTHTQIRTSKYSPATLLNDLASIQLSS
jgi:hypothetical protein